MKAPGASVQLRGITLENFGDCLELELDEAQAAFVAPNVRSLAEAYVRPTLHPFGVYDETNIGFETPVSPMVGFVMVELEAGVGFLLRLMIDRRYQGRGYARGAVREVVRRLELTPEVRLTATSHRRGNAAAAALFRGEGFVPWDVPYARDHPSEVYLRLERYT